MITLTREEAEQVLNWIDRNGEVVFAGGGLSAVLSMNLVAETLRTRLSAPEPEPVAYDFQKALFRAYYLGQRYWADADSESYSANKRADKHRQDFDALCEEAISYTAPPQRKEPEPVADKYLMEIECTKCGAKQDGILTVNTPSQREWQGLTDEEISNLWNAPGDSGNEFARAIEAKLKEKNNA